MRVGLLGAGTWGANHLRALAAMRDAGLLEGVVVADADAARARAEAAKVRADAAQAPEALLRDGSVNAVVVATPTPTHFALARAALEAGKHVLVEKPMTERLGDARALVGLAEREGLVLMPGHLFRYHPGVVWVRAALERGALGELRWMEVVRHAFRAPRSDMGVLAALGVHELDLFCHLLGREYPDTLRCATAGWHGAQEELAWLELRFGAVVGHATESWVSPWAGKERRLAVFGDRGAAVVDFLVHDRLELHDHAYEGADALRAGAPRAVSLQGPEPLRAQLEDFVRCAASGAKPLADGACGMRAVAMLEAAAASARHGGRQERTFGP